MTTAVLMTCHDRREMTLRCLRALAGAAKEAERHGGAGRWNLHVFLVDDGSTDGTGDEIVQLFGSVDRSFAGMKAGLKVQVIRGDGTLFWAKGMELAWREALKHEAVLRSTTTTFSYDAFLWLNDDAALRPDSLSALLRSYTADKDAVIVGELENARREIVYGRRGDLFTGNFVLVPRKVYEKVGMICGAFHHAWADSDYALRCKHAGVSVVSCGVVGACEGHPNRPSLVGTNLRSRWKMLGDPKGWCVHDLWLYRRRNWGICAAIASCAHLVLHVLTGERA